MCWPGCRGACWSGGGPGFRAPLKPGDRWPGWRLPRLARSACSSRAGRPVAGLVRCSEGARAPARESAPLTPPPLTRSLAAPSRPVLSVSDPARGGDDGARLWVRDRPRSWLANSRSFLPSFRGRLPACVCGALPCLWSVGWKGRGSSANLRLSHGVDQMSRGAPGQGEKAFGWVSPTGPRPEGPRGSTRIRPARVRRSFLGVTKAVWTAR